jgi:hypothetical protein
VYALIALESHLIRDVRAPEATFMGHAKDPNTLSQLFFHHDSARFMTIAWPVKDIGVGEELTRDVLAGTSPSMFCA